MVLSDTGLPDPDNPNEDLRVSSDTIIGVTEDDSDQETETFQLEYAQYQPLPTCPTEEPESSSDNEESESIENVTDSTTIPVPPITPMESTLLKEVWSEPSPELCDIKMDSQKVDEVKQAMLNITLPDSAIPDWAANIPEEEWKLQLMKRLKK